jgi:hypothetical protein
MTYASLQCLELMHVILLLALKIMSNCFCSLARAVSSFLVDVCIVGMYEAKRGWRVLVRIVFSPQT